jgi:hypothetical protein
LRSLKAPAPAAGNLRMEGTGFALLVVTLLIGIGLCLLAQASPGGATKDLVNQIVPIGLGLILMYSGYRCIMHAPFQIVSPIPWFLAACMLYYGAGPLLYYLGDKATRSIADDFFRVSTDEIVRANLLNLIGILTIVLVLNGALALSDALRRPAGTADRGTWLQLAQIKVMVLLALAIAVPIKYFVVLPFEFGLTDSTEILPGAILQLKDLVPVSLTLLVVLAIRCRGIWLGLAVVTFSAELLVSILTFSKLEVLTPLILTFIGIYICYRGRATAAAGLIVFVLSYFAMVPLVNYGRIEIAKQTGGDFLQMDLAGRFDILTDFVSGDTSQAEDGSAGSSAWARLNYTNVQAFVMRRYDRGNPGETIANALIAPVPRALWPDKPIISAAGTELTHLITGSASQSSTGVGVFAEAYWSGGWPLVFLVSTYIGLLFAGFTVYAQRQLSQSRLIYLPIMFIGMRAGFRPDGWFAIDYVGLPLFAVIGHGLIYGFFALLPTRLLFRERPAPPLAPRPPVRPGLSAPGTRP